MYKTNPAEKNGLSLQVQPKQKEYMITFIYGRLLKGNLLTECSIGNLNSLSVC
jgi:hypothetical protein